MPIVFTGEPHQPRGKAQRHFQDDFLWIVVFHPWQICVFCVLLFVLVFFCSAAKRFHLEEFHTLEQTFPRGQPSRRFVFIFVVANNFFFSQCVPKISKEAYFLIFLIHLDHPPKCKFLSLCFFCAFVVVFLCSFVLPFFVCDVFFFSGPCCIPPATFFFAHQNELLMWIEIFWVHNLLNVNHVNLNTTTNATKHRLLLGTSATHRVHPAPTCAVLLPQPCILADAGFDCLPDEPRHKTKLPKIDFFETNLLKIDGLFFFAHINRLPIMIPNMGCSGVRCGSL